jgi:hypothetical protein
MAVSELNEKLGLTETGITVFEGIDSNEQCAEKTAGCLFVIRIF